MRSSILLSIAIGLGVGTSGVAGQDASYPRADLLMSPTELAKPRVAMGFVILDVRRREAYDLAHVPRARHVDHDAWKAAFKENQGPQRWSERIGELGIDSDSAVVVYDDSGMKDAGRIWWILRYWGVEHSRLLNGGWSGWISAGLPTTDKTPPAVLASQFKATPHAGRLATMEQVLDLLRDDRLQIVDARSDDEFCGIEKGDNKRGGAIPGAKHLEWSELIDQQTQRFKSPDELRQLLDRAGIELDRPTASHCNGGGRGAVMAFGLELMGAKDVRNYYRGWGEWGNVEDTPIQIPEKP